MMTSKITLFAVALAIAFTAACHKKQVVQEKAITPVRVAAVDVYQPKSGARYSAAILPGRQVSLSFRLSGLVSSIYRTPANRGLEPGDMVNAGSVLATIRQDDYNHSAAQARSQLDAARDYNKSAAAQVAQAEASLVKAEADFARAQALIDSKSLTRPEFDSAKTQRDVAVAQLNAARAALDQAGAQVRNAEAALSTARLAQTDTALVAPFMAAVVQRNVELGMMAGPSSAAYTLADIATVKAAFGVPDTVVVKLRKGRNISVTVEALPGREFQGSVTSIAAVADADTRLFQVEIAIDNRSMMLKPGMIAALELENESVAPAVPVVPLSAVVRDRTNPSDFSVMVVEGKVAKARRVSLGSTFGEMLAVTSGLKPGELVIRAGGTLVTDGEAVEVIR